MIHACRFCTSALLLLLLLVSVQEAAATNTVTCGRRAGSLTHCCKSDPTCDLAPSPSAVSLIGETGSARSLSDALDSLAGAWGVPKQVVLHRIGQEQRRIVLSTQAEADSLGLSVEEAQQRIQLRLKTHEDLLLGRFFETAPATPGGTTTVTTKGASFGTVPFLAVLLLLGLACWGLAAFRSVHRPQA